MFEFKKKYFTRKIKDKPSKSIFREIVEVVTIVAVLRSFLFQMSYIPSGSMYPTLVVGDYIALTKYTYGYSRYSFPFGSYWLPDFGRIAGGDIKQGDVAVFRVRQDDLDFIKRVIAKEGDTVQMKHGRLYINGAIVPREQIDNSIVDGVAVPTYIETLPNGVKHKIWQVGGDNHPYSDNTQLFNVPKGHYFMMGDNRDASDDSRFSRVGFVSYDSFVGKARRIMWSLGSATTIQVWRWASEGDLGRMGKAID